MEGLKEAEVWTQKENEKATEKMTQDRRGETSRDNREITRERESRSGGRGEGGTYGEGRRSRETNRDSERMREINRDSERSRERERSGGRGRDGGGRRRRETSRDSERRREISRQTERRDGGGRGHQ